MTCENESPLVMIGIDAADWDVINPLLDSNKLPHLSYLLREGSHGKLRSFIRYPSPALWTTISTGVFPDKHGVQDFYSDTRLHIRVPTVFNILDGNTGSVGLFRWSATWPPVQNAGFTVPAYTARSPETYPQKLCFLNDLARPVSKGSYIKGGAQGLLNGIHFSTAIKSAIELIYEVITRPEQREWWYRRRLLETVIYGDVFTYLLRKYRPLFSAILFSITDDFGHHYWKYRQPELFDDVSQAEARKYGDVIDKAYIAIDKVIGNILKTLPENTLVIVLSDHGQHAISPKTRPYRISAQKLTQLMGFNDKVWATDLGYDVLFRSKSDSDLKTPQELNRALMEIRLSVNEEPVFEILAEEPTSLLVKVGIDRETSLSDHAALPNGQTIRLEDILFTRGQISGHHTEFGILIMQGPGVPRGGVIRDASILDVTPTLLALRGKPVSREIDGKVLNDAIDKEFLEEKPVNYVDSYSSEDQRGVEVPFTAEELETLEAKLRDMGYLA